MIGAGPVHAERGDDPAVPAVEGDEAALLQRALARPRPRRPGRAGRPAGACGRTGRTRTTAPARRACAAGLAGQERAGRRARPGRCAWSQCSTRIISPKVGFGQRATSPAATTPGAARQVSSHDHAVVEREARALEPAGAGRDADADHHDVGVDRAAVAELDPLDPGAALEAGHPDAEAHVDAVVAVHVGARCSPISAPSTRAERGGQRLDHRDLEARARGRWPPPRRR